MTDTLTRGITRDDTEHGELYFTEAQMREAMARSTNPICECGDGITGSKADGALCCDCAHTLRARVAELEAKLAEAGKDAAPGADMRAQIDACRSEVAKWPKWAKQAMAVDAAIAAKEQAHG